MQRAVGLCVLFAAMPACPATAQVALAFRNTLTLPATAPDGQGSVEVSGLSGVTYVGGDRWLAVMDNSDLVVDLRITIAGNGSILGASFAGVIRLDAVRDHEDLAWTPWGTMLVVEEDTPAAREHVSGGSLIASLPVPSIFTTRRANFGFESVTLGSDGSHAWVCNEEALSGDGPLSTPTAGTRVRFQRLDRRAGQWQIGPQYAYHTDPMHAGPVSGGRSGVSALAELPSGRLLVLERSFAGNPFRFFESRIYLADTSAASRTESIPSLLDPHVPVAKRRLYIGSHTNLEGLAVGPALASGGRVLLGIVDSGDLISVNQLLAWVASGDVEAPCRSDFDGDGFVDFFDLDAFVACFEGEGCPPGRSADFDLDGFVDFFDFDSFIGVFESGC
jgi:hypothetical protein